MSTLAAVTFTASPSTLGADDMAYTPSVNTDITSASMLIYADHDAYMNFQLGIIDNDTFNQFDTNGYGDYDGLALRGSVTYAGANASA